MRPVVARQSRIGLASQQFRDDGGKGLPTGTRPRLNFAPYHPHNLDENFDASATLTHRLIRTSLPADQGAGEDLGKKGIRSGFRQFRNCPRNCWRRACPTCHWRESRVGKAGPGDDPQVRKPASISHLFRPRWARRERPIRKVKSPLRDSRHGDRLVFKVRNCGPLGRHARMKNDLAYLITTLRLDDSYHPSDSTRATTNFANLARGELRQENLRNALAMIDNRFNALANWDNPSRDRYSVELDIISVALSIGDRRHVDAFPLIEILKPTIIDRVSGKRIDGIAGNNFSSYVRDYDFSVILPRHNRDIKNPGMPEDFGDLHGNLFKSFLDSAAYRQLSGKPPVICLSVSTSRTYHRTENLHPILGFEYRQGEFSATDRYFAKMGLQVRNFMPPDAVAPLAFYHTGDLLNDYSPLELVGTISTMEAFQRIYRPEIYNANSPAGAVYRPSLTHKDYSLSLVTYDREERSRLAVEQGRFAEENFITPYQDILAEWSARYAA